MFSFRKKTLLIHALLLCVCSAVFFSLIQRMVNRIVIHSVQSHASELVRKIQAASHFDGMIDYLSAKKAFVFFRITLFDRQGKLLYDSHLPLSNETRESSEVLSALKYGQGYEQRYSPIFRQSIVYAALLFDLDGQDYVLRVGLPFALDQRELQHPHVQSVQPH